MRRLSDPPRIFAACSAPRPAALPASRAPVKPDSFFGFDLSAAVGGETSATTLRRGAPIYIRRA